MNSDYWGDIQLYVSLFLMFFGAILAALNLCQANWLLTGIGVICFFIGIMVGPCVRK
jgi:1,4-dihydroxy-2-naphthoate octaprenyltransferase